MRAPVVGGGVLHGRSNSEPAGTVTVACAYEPLRSKKAELRDRSSRSPSMRSVSPSLRSSVMLAVSPSRFGGSIYDLALLCALADSSGGAVATVEPLVTEQVDQLRLFRMAEILTTYGEMLDEMRRQDDVYLLRRSLAWPPSGDTDPAK